MMNYASVAMIAHEANRAYCTAIGDDSQTSWVDAPEWQRESARNGVRFLRANPNAGPDAAHVSWLAEKAAAGWTYGKVKDPIAKTHPCFVPYEQLPAEQRVKDALFVAIVRACSESMEEAGVKVA